MRKSHQNGQQILDENEFMEQQRSQFLLFLATLQFIIPLHFPLRACVCVVLGNLGAAHLKPLS